MQMGFDFFLRCFKTIVIIIVITFNVMVIDYSVVLFTRNRNRAGGK